MTDTPLEKIVEKKSCDYAKSLGYLTYKFNSEARRSVPDREFISPRGVIFFIEFKRKGKKPTPSQFREIARLISHNVPTFVIDDSDECKTLIDYIQMGFDPMVLSIENNKKWSE